MDKREPDLWLNAVLLEAFMKNGFAQLNGNKSWELTDLQYLHLTDDLAKGFLELAKHPIYRTQSFELEIGLIRQQAAMIAQAAGNEPFNLIDMYCGDGLKAVEFVKVLNAEMQKPVRIRYCPFNASRYLLDTAVENMKKANLPNVVEYKPILSAGHGDSLRTVGRQLRAADFPKHVVLVLGGVIACFQINSYLFELRRDLLRDDVLVIGNGVRTGERLVGLDKYKSPLFHNWFKHLIFDLGFNEDDVEFDVRFGNSRVEFFYRLKRPLTKKAGKRMIAFKAGDELVVAALYKYYAAEFDQFCKMYFADSHVVTDEENEYALVVCKK